MNMTRIWEKIAGIPHQSIMFDRVSKAADGLTATARNIKERLEPYRDAPDPFTALMADLYEQRQEENLHKGPNQ
jgi:hypothetical protein